MSHPSREPLSTPSFVTRSASSMSTSLRNGGGCKADASGRLAVFHGRDSRDVAPRADLPCRLFSAQVAPSGGNGPAAAPTISPTSPESTSTPSSVTRSAPLISISSPQTTEIVLASVEPAGPAHLSSSACARGVRSGASGHLILRRACFTVGAHFAAMSSNRCRPCRTHSGGPRSNISLGGKS